MVTLEICINCVAPAQVRANAAAAAEGGAARIELCRAMAHDGLTPQPAHIEAARAVFPRAGLLTMIRPRSGDFAFSSAEVDLMQYQIRQAAACGADGIVLGVLRTPGGQIAARQLDRLLTVARNQALAVTFHRAFDATPDPPAALETLIEHGVQRVLTSGRPWSQPGSALEGAARLHDLLLQARGRIEIVIGGGVTAVNTPALLSQLPPASEPMSLHAYSDALADGMTDVERVRALVAAASYPLGSSTHV